MEARILGHEHADAALDMVVVAIAGWLQRDQQAAIVYLLEENRVCTAPDFLDRLNSS